MELSMSKMAAGLVVRDKEVELFAVQGKSVTARVRVPMDGNESHQLTHAIQKALSVSNLRTKRLAVSIPSQDVLFRFFTIPSVPKAELDAAVQFEARKYIPFKTELLIWDYRAIPSSVSGQLGVIFAAIPKELFNSLQEAFAAAGVQPTIIEPRSLSLARLVEGGKADTSNEFVCLVDVDDRAAHLAIVKDHLPYLTREVSFGSPQPSEPTAELLRTPVPSAVDASPPPMEPVSLMSTPEGEVDPRSQRLLSELSVSINFFMREYPSTTIARVVLFGEEARIAPWCRRLSEHLHCSVDLGSLWLDQRVQGGLPLSFASAVGLLQGVSDPKSVSLDFLKRSLIKPAGPQRSQVLALPMVPKNILGMLKSPQATVCASMAAGLLAIFWFLGSLMVSVERRQMEQVAQSSADVGWGLKEMTQEELEALKQKSGEQLSLLKRIIDQRERVAAQLDVLVRSVPEGVWFTGIAFQEGIDGQKKRLSVTGACFLPESGRQLTAIQKFEEQVKRNPIFAGGFRIAQVGQIKIRSEDPERPSYRTFQLNCEL